MTTKRAVLMSLVAAIVLAASAAWAATAASASAEQPQVASTFGP